MKKRTDIIANDQQTAIKYGILTYHGRPCPECGKTKRYAVSRGCFDCERAKSKSKNELRRLQRQKEQEMNFSVIGQGWQY